MATTAFTLTLLLGAAVVGAALAFRGGELLVEAADSLGAYYGLPPVVQGAVVAAVGSSFPELASTVIASVRYGAFEIGVGAVVGSAVFNILVIPAISALAGGGSLASNRDLVFKEAQFYLLSIAVVFLTFTLAVVYDGTAVGDPLTGEITPGIAIFPLLLYGLYIFIQYHDTLEHRLASPFGVDPDAVNVEREWARLVVSLVVIVVSAELLVRAAVGFGDAFGTSTFLWGLTVVAAGTSLPDTFVSVVAARRGNADVSLANVLGSNIFALLVVLPVGVLAAGRATISLGAVVPMMGFLVVASVAFFAVLRTEMRLSRREAYLLVGTYLAFLAWLTAESLGLSSFIV
ncbi:sodium:calcium antiporter [Halogeometricum borinquense]|uniref:Sodium:calcium antiporter n=1 Tax=Halogeometricum borinquense TaxID=60847 RepID=A0A6C0UME6_9EURY|nr:sodium:calcium antiporter [Halogeometricum borinquense]QIB75743.1 sodium:calcium antiporter [Halogeometricum borinquense]QIQ75740.1 sodium:calcium antiporter [Halogeometricum borinquense]